MTLVIITNFISGCESGPPPPPPPPTNYYLDVSIDSPVDSFLESNTAGEIRVSLGTNDTVTSIRYLVSENGASSWTTVCQFSSAVEICSWDRSDELNFPNGSYTIKVEAESANGKQAQDSASGQIFIAERLSPRWDKDPLITDILPALENPASPPANVTMTMLADEAVGYSLDTFCIPFEVTIVESATANYQWGADCPTTDCTRVKALVRAFIQEDEEGNQSYVTDPEPASVVAVYEIQTSPAVPVTAPDAYSPSTVCGTGDN